mgnify:CR=1 FL=1
MIDKNFIILAAGEPQLGDLPVLLTEVNGQTLFDWQINAWASLSSSKPQVVVGYAAEKFKILSGRALLRLNDRWQNTNSGYSLFSADLSGDSVIVSYADILYRPSIIDRLTQSDSDVTLVYDSCWKQRFTGRSEQDLIDTEKVVVSKSYLLNAGQDIPLEWAQGEFIGLVYFQGAAMECLRDMQNKINTPLENVPLSGLVEWLRLQGLKVTAIDVEGDWAELNEPKDVAHFILGTKAETLDRLSKMVQKSVVLNQVSFTVADWHEDPQKIKNNIQKVFDGSSVVVRSSAKSEDGFSHSNAGAYSSLLNVDPKKGLHDAILEVINSYGDCQLDDQVLVQPMLRDVRLSGVAFTRTLEESAPFYIVNYDETGDTESITSGSAKKHKCLYLRRDAKLTDVPDMHLMGVIEAIREVEYLLKYDALDLEFAVDKKGTVYLLQVRPMATSDSKSSELSSTKILQLQEKSFEYWLSLQAASPQIKGDKALFGVMPDWNPAEIIGINPGQLSVSLYEYLILNDIWARQRAEYGYKDVRPQPLLRIFAGKPYVDIRASFNTFIPKALSDNLSNKLVNFYLNWLEAHPHLHDKVEFEVVPTCVGPMFSKWEKRLSEKAGLLDEEIKQLKQGLLSITRDALTRTSQYFVSLDVLKIRHDQILSNKTLSSSEKIRILLENCKEFGTLPFAHLARSGFIAVTLLKEGVDAGWLSTDARDGFMETIHTVSYELIEDSWRVAQEDISWEDFVVKYGHLRPGTYDITTPAYRDDPEQFLRPIANNACQPKHISAQVENWHSEKEHFFSNLRNMGLDAKDDDFERFLTESIEGREKAKFIFSRSLSESLSLIESEGAKYKLTHNVLSNLSLTELLSAFNSGLPLEELTQSLLASSHQNQQARLLSHACRLPPILCSSADFIGFISTEEKPNFIGTARITAPVAHLSGTGGKQLRVEGCIVVIPQADPGYDWLFGQKIVGLITMFGGANSHMAIRAAEFGLPAAIGVGEQLYNIYNSAKSIELDAAGETIRVLQ